jgi:two-component system cell cycle response regulator CpdR
MKVLVAEDDTAIMKAYQLALKSRNHEIFSALDGEECLRIFNDQLDHIRKKDSAKTDPHYGTSRTPPFDLVILDYRMPKKNGMEVAEQILAKVPEQRIIIASAYTNELKLPSNSQQSLELLQKPFELDVLLSLIETAQGGWIRKSGQKPLTNNDSSIGNVGTNASLDEQFNKTSESLDLFELGAAVILP